MDERSQQGHPLPQQAATPHGHTGMPAAAPWPTYAAPQQGAPLAGHAPFPGPAQPQPQAQAFAPAPQQHVPAPQQSHQFQYAPQGYVLPGATQDPGHPAPMSAHGGTIGMAQHAAPTNSMPVLNGGPHHQGALAIDPNSQPQAWAFPTPQGMQLVQPGAGAQMMTGHAQMQMQPQPLPQPQYGAPMLQAHAAVAPMRTARRRMRWETIVPAFAVVCLVASIGFFISDFDKITGRDAGGAEQASMTTPDAMDGGTDATDPSGDATEVVAQATTLFREGRFEDAANLLHPVLDVESPDPAAVALHDKVDAAKVRNDALLTRLATERRAKQWTRVVATIGQLEQLRPLSADLTKLRVNARTAAKSSASMAQAKRYMAQGRYSQAMTIVERGLKASPKNRQLLALREQISARQAAPSTIGAGTSRSGSTPPSSGGRTSGGGSTTARPPASVPSSSIPKIPDVPNPTGGTAGTGAGAVGGGAGAADNCHVHDGVTSCHD